MEAFDDQGKLVELGFETEDQIRNQQEQKIKMFEIRTGMLGKLM